MAETTEQSSEETNQAEFSFVWDDQSQLYFHASSGFYHDPNAGWYYSTRDGLYYKFEDGNYVLLKGDGPEDQMSEQPSVSENLSAEPCTGNMESSSNDNSEVLRPTSEWLEDTLITMYLSGYSNPEKSAGEYTSTPLETEDGIDGNEEYELEEGEWIPEHDETDPRESEPDADHSSMSRDEENWLAQYGQVIQPEDETIITISAVDLWDWEMILSMRKDGKGQACRLVGRLVKQNTKLHPSMPAGGRHLKTAPVIEARLDLVRVTTGQVYKLRNPSAKYLASLPVYDSSNPTKDWGFPTLAIDKLISPARRSTGNLESETSQGKEKFQEMHKIGCTSEKQKAHAYRDRAAERRNLHGGFGVGPGQKKTTDDDDDSPSSPVSVPTEIAAAEALNLSFGAGSFSRKLLEKMGWKEGEALGKTNKGLKEPLQAVQNKGNTGLGWGQKHGMHR
ncbi:unnamed protein product [Rhodiola kirilowii]